MIIWITLYLGSVRRIGHRRHTVAYHSGANSGSSRNSFSPSQQILPIISPENAEKAWSRRMIEFVPFKASIRLASFSTTSDNICWRRETPRREKKGSSGFLLRRCRSWDFVSRCEPAVFSRISFKIDVYSHHRSRCLSQKHRNAQYVSYFPKHISHCRHLGHGWITRED